MSIELFSIIYNKISFEISSSDSEQIPLLIEKSSMPTFSMATHGVSYRQGHKRSASDR